MENKHILLQDLEIYKLARELSRTGWDIYSDLDWQLRKITGDQFIESVDSVGANIAEGYKRFHYLERIRFCYISRASLGECNDHWIELLYERKKVSIGKYQKFKEIANKLSLKLNNFIASLYRSKANNIH